MDFIHNSNSAFLQRYQGELHNHLRILFPKLLGYLLSIVLVLGMFVVNKNVYGQASLAAEDIVDELVVCTNGEGDCSKELQAGFTVLRDSRNKSQWYYVPDRPRLFERNSDDEPIPEFSLIRYEYDDPTVAGKIVRGGLLQFALSMQLPAGALEQLNKKLTEKLRSDGLSSSAPRLSALPLKSAVAHIYTPDGNLIASAPLGTGTAPTFATQKMVFSIPLTDIGTDVYETLIEGNTGIPVSIEMTFNRLTPPAGFEIEVDFKKAFNHYSKNEKFRARASYYGLFSASYSKETSEIRETLEKSEAITIKATTSESLTQEDIDQHIQPFIKRINDEILEDSKPPPKIDPAAASTPDTGGYFGGAGYSVAMKKVDINTLSTKTISYSSSAIEERKTTAEGFIGIGQYSDSVKNDLVTIVPPGPWKKAFFTLPPISAGNDLNIEKIDLQVDLTVNDKQEASKFVSWTQENGWRNETKDPVDVLVFGLTALYGRYSDDDIKDAKFKVSQQIVSGRDSLPVSYESEVFGGVAAIAEADPGFEVIQIDGEYLTFKKLDKESPLLGVTIELKSGSRASRQQMKVRNVDGVNQYPNPIRWVVPKNESKNAEPVTAKIIFRVEGGKAIEWVDNGKNIRAGDYQNYLILEDSHWQNQ